MRKLFGNVYYLFVNPDQPDKKMPASFHSFSKALFSMDQLYNFRFAPEKKKLKV